MGGVVVLGECMVELSLEGSRAAIGYAGDVFNTGVYLRRLGQAVSFASALGTDDPFTGAILNLMAAEGIDGALMARVPGSLPGLYAIERDEAGERRFFYWREQAPVRRLFEVADVPALVAALRQADLVYLSGITLAVLGEDGRARLGEMLADLAARGVAIAFDPNYRARLWPSVEAARAAMTAVIPYCRLVSASGTDIETLFETPLAAVAANWTRQGPQVVARDDDRTVTVYAGDDVLRLAPSPAPRAVDTTGAGDSFNGGYLAGWLAGAPPERCVDLGRRLAAVVVQHAGAIIPRAAMPPLAV